MQLQHIELNQFRNLESQLIEFPSRVTLLSGRNGQGKTSLLEAVFFLAHAKSFRESRTKELIRWSENGQSSLPESRLLGLIESTEGQKEIECRITGNKNSAYINGNRVEKASSFYGQLACVVFTPDELQLVKGPPQGRRKFIDRIFAMVDRAYVETIVQYQRSVKSRNSVLASARDGSIPQVQVSAHLEPWNQLVISQGLEIVRRRLALISEFSPTVESYYQQLVGLPESKEQVRIEYQSKLVENKSVVSADRAHELLSNRIEKDIALRTTSLGPHRDDIDLLLESGYGFRSARIAASQGQARSLALALKMAAIDYLKQKLGEAPVVLLDDVESELDRSRKDALYRMISGFNSQIIITATEVSEELIQAVEQPTLLVVSDGKITPHNLS